MRLTAFFTFVLLMQVTASVYSQQTKLSLKLEDASLEQVFRTIQEQSDFTFFYKTDQIPSSKKVSVNYENIRIEDILDRILQGTNLGFYILDHDIVITPRSGPNERLSQQITAIKGKVTDSNGEPLPGVSVVVKGTTNGIITSTDGKYSLSGIPTDATLVFSFVGMKTREVVVGNQTSINVTMIEETIGIEEVVAVGYGTRRRSDITGSVATVKAGELATQPTSDLQGMLKGKVAGLYVTMADARPGGDSRVLLRGIRSLKGSNSPLFVVDGTPLGSVNELNIEDVESISVLKDATSQAIYGARAANGVILITTKRGKNTNNKVEVSYHGYCSIQNVDPNFEIFSPEEFVQLRREAYRGDLATAENGWVGTYPDDEEMFTPLELESMANKRYVNWTDYAFKKDVPLTKHDLSLSGGNEKTMYSASLGYYYQDGPRFSSGLKRYSGKLTLDQEISKTFKTGLSVYYITSTQDTENNSWLSFITFSPIAQIYDENGDLIPYPTGGTAFNPLLYEELRNNEHKTERIVLNGYLEITPQFLPGLKYKLNASLDSRNQENNQFISFDDPGYLTKGNASVNYAIAKGYLLENIITYDRIFGKDHHLDITAMQGIETNSSTSTTATATQLGNDFFGVNSMVSALESEIGRSLSDRKIASFMGRINYIFKDKYLLNLTMRADGSSVFGANHKWGYFPSAAIAWNLHKESFTQSVRWIDEAKIRVSYGQIGNQAISPYGSLALANTILYVSNGTPILGYTPGSTLPNPDLRWETTTTLNMGTDFSVINRRLSGSIEYYQSSTTDLLVDRSVPTVLGYSQIPTNLGEIQNKGVEASLTGFIVSNDQLNWSVTANFSKNKNKLVRGVLQDASTGEYIDDISNRWFIGESVNVYYDYQFNGIWQLGDDIANSAQPAVRPGDVKVADVSGPEGVPDGTITTDDRIIIRRDPKWIGSFSTSLSYKGFEFSADLYTVQGIIRFNDFLQEFNYGGRMDGSRNGIKRDYWTPENPSNTTFRPHRTNFSDYRNALAYQDASYLRLRNVTIAYNLPKKWVTVAGLSRVRFYVAGDNLWTKTDYLSYSPEGDADDYPETRIYTLGLNINF
ncbi:MAG: TonB-dependent receptor [Mangrovibacterium sp.]